MNRVNKTKFIALISPLLFASTSHALIVSSYPPTDQINVEAGVLCQTTYADSTNDSVVPTLKSKATELLNSKLRASSVTITAAQPTLITQATIIAQFQASPIQCVYDRKQYPIVTHVSWDPMYRWTVNCCSTVTKK